MDPTSDPGMSDLLKIIGAGGNGAMMFLAFLAWQLWKKVRETLTAIRDSILGMRDDSSRAQAQLLHGQKQLKRAVASLSATARAHIDED